MTTNLYQYPISILLFFFLLISVPMDAQRQISGIITDDVGEPLIGAGVLLKGTTIGTTTDLDGTYSLTVPEGKFTLLVSYTGYETKEVVIEEANKSKRFDVSLSGGLQLCEVVVTGMKASATKRVLGYQNAPASASVITGSKNRKKRKNRKKKKAQASAPIAQTTHQNKVVHNTEDYASIKENIFLEATKEPLSTFSIDVDAAAYSNVRRFIKQQQLPPKDAVRIEELINYFNYDYPNPTGAHPFELITELSTCPWNPEHQLLHIGLQGKKIEKDSIPPSNLVFLLDVSGSMGTYDKLPLLKKAFHLLIDELRPIDTIAIVVYAGASGVVLPPTSGSEKETIKKALKNLEAGGSTAGAAGIQLAYQIAGQQFKEEGNNRVILATDGDFNVGVSSDGGLVNLIEEKRKSNIFLTVLGFGMGNYKDNKMQQLANKGNGNHAYIDNLQEAKKVLVNEFGSTLFTIAKDVKLQLEFNPTNVQGYRLIGYENRLLENEDFNNDLKDAGELGAGHTVTALYEIIPKGVDSDFLSSVDPLKYQKQKTKKPNALSAELVTLKLRYKKPKGLKSQLLTQVVSTQITPIAKTSNNFRFAASVASFGLLLRDSPFKKNASYDAAIHLAKESMGTDIFGYRKAYMDIVQEAEALTERMSVDHK